MSAMAGAKHNLSSTPASSALAIGFGMPATMRPSAGTKPVITISKAHSIIAPVASPKPPGKTAVVARKAAPGVDQATAAGVRVSAGSQILQTPIPNVAKKRPVAACSAVAPTAVIPARTIANDDV